MVAAFCLFELLTLYFGDTTQAEMLAWLLSNLLTLP